MDLRIVAPIVDKNLLLVEELSQQLVPGQKERLAFLKRFVFQAEGCFFVYESSVPHSVQSNEDAARDDATKYDVVFSIMCFKNVGGNLIMERIK